MTTVVAGIGVHVRAVTPTAARAQADFRALLNVLSRPGVLDTVGGGDGPAVLAVAAGLADVEVPTAVLAAPGEEHWERALHLGTSAPPAPPHEARMVVALRSPTAAEVGSLITGDAMHPELGTRLLIAVADLEQVALGAEGRDRNVPTAPETRDTEGQDRNVPAITELPDLERQGENVPALGVEGSKVVLALTGPGVPGTRRLRVTGLSREVFEALVAANAGFPAGIDTFLVTPDGTVAGLPRSTRIEIENGEH